MPNPLIKVRPKAIPKVGGDTIASRPKLAPLMLQIIGKGSEIDCHLMGLITHLLSAEAAAVSAMIQTLINLRTKLDVISAGIEKKYSEEDVDIAEAVLTVVRKVSEKRNIIAHNIFAVCEELPDDILFIEPEAYFKKQIDWIGQPVKPFDPEEFVPNRLQIFVYKERDFLEIIKSQDIALAAITHLLHYLLFPDRKDHMRSRLLGVPLIKTAWSQRKASKEKSSRL